MNIFKLTLVVLVCLVSTQLPAAEINEVDLDHFLSEKRTLLEANLSFTEQEKQAFWPLYDDYMKESVKLLERRTLLTRKFVKDQETITDKKARALIDEYFETVDEGVKVKKSMLARLRRKLPEIKVLKFFQFEIKVEAGYFAFLAENIPMMK